MGRHENGGVIGAFVTTTASAAKGVWGLNAQASRAGQNNTSSVNVWPSGADASFASVVNLTHFESTTGSVNSATAAYPDSSGIANLSCKGSTAQGSLATTQFKFGQYSLGCGTGAAYAGSSGTSASYNFSTNDFTLECWIYLTATTTAGAVIDIRATTASTISPQVYVATDGSLRYFLSNADRITGAASGVSLNAWHHVAACRVSSVTRLFIDGTQTGSNFSDSNTYVNGNLYYGAAINGNSGLIGFLDEARITKGVGRYAANFTAPTTPFPDY